MNINRFARFAQTSALPFLRLAQPSHAVVPVYQDEKPNGGPSNSAAGSASPLTSTAASASSTSPSPVLSTGTVFTPFSIFHSATGNPAPPSNVALPANSTIGTYGSFSAVPFGFSPFTYTSSPHVKLTSESLFSEQHGEVLLLNDNDCRSVSTEVDVFGPSPYGGSPVKAVYANAKIATKGASVAGGWEGLSSTEALKASLSPSQLYEWISHHLKPAVTTSAHFSTPLSPNVVPMPVEKVTLLHVHRLLNLATTADDVVLALRLVRDLSDVDSAKPLSHNRSRLLKEVSVIAPPSHVVVSTSSPVPTSKVPVAATHNATASAIAGSVTMTTETLSLLIKACCRADMPDTALSAIRHAQDLCLGSPSLKGVHYLMVYYAIRKDLSALRSMLDSLQGEWHLSPTARTYHILVRAHADAGELMEAVGLLKQALSSSTSPRGHEDVAVAFTVNASAPVPALAPVPVLAPRLERGTFNVVMNAARRVGDAGCVLCVFDWMNTAGVAPNAATLWFVLEALILRGDAAGVVRTLQFMGRSLSALENEKEKKSRASKEIAEEDDDLGDREAMPASLVLALTAFFESSAESRDVLRAAVACEQSGADLLWVSGLPAEIVSVVKRLGA
ncbi:mitochondrial pentatricopeptide repeat (PPR) protein [Andalucia godoyi]|uniref:Mitochondrial pentatricopeptide repeat (PPR) protein n=1 Tax=Andalucia godoyi TaxID=505711 RepID=A0A8K0AHV2_ANDGO|nr:mitochondrial pentatricopeptide repeat (PPR) protein [Andalucia godoyi]|eukprot:ANDGO_04124.mRNA.1 mitochondrial pentatricopeptide repeat (PPR) protein